MYTMHFYQVFNKRVDKKPLLSVVVQIFSVILVGSIIRFKISKY